MSPKRPPACRLVTLAASLVCAAGSVSCASNGGPEPWACGLAGQVLGGGAGAAAGIGLAGDNKELGAAIGGGAAGAIVVGIAAWQICEVVAQHIDDRKRAENEHRAAVHAAEEARLAADAARVAAAEEARRKTEEARLAAEKARRDAAARAALLNDSTRPEIVLSGAAFAAGSASVSPETQTRLDEVAATLAKYPDLRVRISGHTDSTGDASRNLALSTRRAESVRSYLIAKGVSGDRLSAIGLGENSPVETNGTAAGRAANRRVELDLMD